MSPTTSWTLLKIPGKAWESAWMCCPLHFSPGWINLAPLLTDILGLLVRDSSIPVSSLNLGPISSRSLRSSPSITQTMTTRFFSPLFFFSSFLFHTMLIALPKRPAFLGEPDPFREFGLHQEKMHCSRQNCNNSFFLKMFSKPSSSVSIKWLFLALFCSRNHGPRNERKPGSWSSPKNGILFLLIFMCCACVCVLFSLPYLTCHRSC